MTLPAAPQVDVAASLEVSTDLLDTLPSLFEGLEDLGALPEDVVGALTAWGFPQRGKVVDLGCGKGAVALAVARNLKGQVLGVDGIAAFVEHARDSSRRQGMESRCRFLCGDLWAATTSLASESYDAVMLLAVSNVAADPAGTVGRLRRLAKPGGLLLIDDGYSIADPGARERILGGLGSHGDTLLEERCPTAAALQASNRRQQAVIRENARRLIPEWPHRAAEIQAYLQRQDEEVAILEDPGFRCALWVLRRAPGPSRALGCP